jgi:hypothetical protein
MKLYAVLQYVVCIFPNVNEDLSYGNISVCALSLKIWLHDIHFPKSICVDSPRWVRSDLLALEHSPVHDILKWQVGISALTCPWHSEVTGWHWSTHLSTTFWSDRLALEHSPVHDILKRQVRRTPIHRLPERTPHLRELFQLSEVRRHCILELEVHWKRQYLLR